MKQVNCLPQKIKNNLWKIVYLVLLIWAIAVLMPIYWMFVTSLRPQSGLFSHDLIPDTVTLKNYADMFKMAPVLRWFFNSVVVSVTVTSAALLFDSLAGYVFAILRPKGSALLFALILSCMMVPDQTRLVPVFSMITDWNWYNTYFALILPFMGSAFGVFLMRQYMSGIPEELVEAARLDGCNEWTTYMGIARSLSGEIYICGGWGYAFGDEGSAFNIAVKGLRAATQYYDGRGEPTLLYEAMMDFFQLNEPRDLVPILYHPALDRKRAAGFSVCVSKCCEAGDDIACRILEGAAADLASIAGVLIERVEQFSSIAVYGGVLQNDRFVRESFTCRMQKRWPGIKIVDPEMPPEIGAVAAAMQRSGVKVTQDVLNNLRTYQQKAFFTPFAGKSERTQDGCVLARKINY